MSAPLVRLRAVCKSFGPIEVLRDIDLDVDHGQVVVVSYPELRNGQVLGEYTANFLQTFNYGLSKIADLVDRPRRPKARSRPAAFPTGPKNDLMVGTSA